MNEARHMTLIRVAGLKNKSSIKHFSLPFCPFSTAMAVITLPKSCFETVNGFIRWNPPEAVSFIHERKMRVIAIGSQTVSGSLN